MGAHLCRNAGMVYAGSAIASVAWTCTWLSDLELDFLFLAKKMMDFSGEEVAELKSPMIQLPEVNSR